jgi:hypothetical protein
MSFFSFFGNLEWAKVASCLPATGGPHLVYCGRYTDNAPIYLLATWDGTNGVWRTADEGELIATVTHWMPLPGPPPEVQP